MKSTTIESLSNYVTEVDSLQFSGDELILFRGQPVKGNLLPSICRESPEKDTTQKETKMLEELRRMGGSLISDTSMSDWELLIIAQHFGCLLYTSPSPRDRTRSRMPSSA